MTLWWTSLARSMGCDVMDEPDEVTWTAWRTVAGMRLTVRPVTVLTAAATSAEAEANPLAETVIW